MRGIVLPVQVGGLLRGQKGILAPPLKLLGGLPTPMYLQTVHMILLHADSLSRKPFIVDYSLGNKEIVDSLRGSKYDGQCWQPAKISRLVYTLRLSYILSLIYAIALRKAKIGLSECNRVNMSK